MIEHSSIYIGGRWVAPGTAEVTEVVHSGTEEVMGRTPVGDAEDVDRAVSAARDAFAGWSSTRAQDRAKLLDAAVEALLARQTELATMISGEVGMPFAYSNLIQVGLPILSFAAAAALSLGLAPAATAAAAPGPPEKYIVTLKPGADPGTVAAKHEKSRGASVTHVYRHALNGYAASMSPSAAAAIAADPEVAAVIPDLEVHMNAQSVPPGIDRVGADESSAAAGDGRSLARR